ncbi:Pyrimidine-specific ribonucleoside hydrolase RihA [bacterium HR16]|nr:Pyrimidine-specific ribonucleoside hydrolase RihA [bacterium HR16]
MATPLIHQTDLFRPHNDPDDHFDLAVVYALALQGKIDLRGIVIDRPPPKFDGDPDVAAIAQLNHITGLTVPAVVGSSQPMKSPSDTQPSASPSDKAAVRFVLDTLRQSRQRVAITAVGSCRDIALAGKTDPALFARKCAGIYINAGTGSPDPRLAATLEYNVTLDPAAYRALFELPCPIYWLPCFEDYEGEWRVKRHGTYWRFPQEGVLPALSPRMQNFFLYMFERLRETDWLRYLYRQPDAPLIHRYSQQERNMWSVASFLHVAGLTVTVDGEVVPLKAAGGSAVYTFQPVRISCNENAVTTWQPDPRSTNRHMFMVRDVERYQEAMTKALRTLLTVLP